MFRLRPIPDPLPPRADGTPSDAPRLALRLLLSPVLAGAVLCSQAAAQAVTSACEMHDDGAALDLGDGLVAQRWATDTSMPSGSLGALIAHCPTNEGIHVIAQVWNEHGRLPPHGSDPVAIAFEAVSSTDAVTFDELVRRLEAQGFDATRQSPAGTPCACGVFYPGSQGDSW